MPIPTTSLEPTTTIEQETTSNLPSTPDITTTEIPSTQDIMTTEIPSTLDIKTTIITTGPGITEVDTTVTVDSHITDMVDLPSNSEYSKKESFTSVGITKDSTDTVSGGINDLTTTETETVTPEYRVQTEQAIVENVGKERRIYE